MCVVLCVSQVGGLIELLKGQDAGFLGVSSGDFKRITGKNPTTVEEWAAAVGGAFK